MERTGREFDVIHVHAERGLDLPAHFLSSPVIATIHDADCDGCSISDPRNAPPPLISTLKDHGDWLTKYPNWWANIHYGVPRQRLQLSEPYGYLVFDGSLDPHSGLPEALWIARHAGRPLCVIGRGSPEDEACFRELLTPHGGDPVVQLLMGVSEKERYEVLAGASALLVPSTHGSGRAFVTAVEALAAGTPTIARRGGLLDELIVDGKTGFSFDDCYEAVNLIDHIDGLQRAACRAHFERHYTIEMMTDRYESVYRRLLRVHRSGTRASRSPASQVG
jgi:glycosyltransferase involved in cell wall biosynthesis